MHKRSDRERGGRGERNIERRGGEREREREKERGGERERGGGEAREVRGTESTVLLARADTPHNTLSVHRLRPVPQADLMQQDSTPLTMITNECKVPHTASVPHSPLPPLYHSV
jgi:hypothetical protein